jgi:uncharacterized protein
MNLTLIVKPVGSDCNMLCDYCYNNRIRDPLTHERMPPSLLHQLVDQVGTLDLRAVQFMWHGGEPLLAGIGFYRQAVALQQGVLKNNGTTIVNSLQTNGTLINQSWVDFFRAEHFRVGVSIDGPQFIHDKHRVDMGKQGTFHRVMNGVNLLQGGRVRFGANAVVTQSTLPYPTEVYEFYRDNGLSPCDFSPFAEIDPETGLLYPHSVSPREYADFLKSIFALWFEDDDPNFRIRRFSEYIQAALGKPQRLCVFQHSCHRYLAIEYDGEVYACGRFARSEITHLGNITQQPLSELLQSKKYREVVAVMNADKAECADCQWKHACKGGCNYYRYFHTGDLNGPEYFCETHKTMFEFVHGQVSQVRRSAGI